MTSSSPAKFRFWSVEFLIVLYSMFVITSSMDTFFAIILHDSGSSEGEPNPFRQLLMLPTYIYMSAWMFQHMGAVMPTLRRGWLLILILLLSLASTLWSIEPAATLRRSIEFVLGTSFAFYLAARYTPTDFCRLMAKCWVYICLFTLLVVFAAPSVGIHHDGHYPALRGYFPQKNAMGAVMVVGTLLGIVLMRLPKDRRLGRLVFVLSLGLAILSLSRTAWINLFGVAMSMGMISFIRKRKAIGVFLFGSGVLVAAATLGFVGFDTAMSGFTSALGRSADLSDRGEVWPKLIEVVSRDHLLLGYGYDVFWTSYKGALGVAWDASGWIPPHAHNGWLQSFTHLGLVGVVLMTLFTLQGVIRCFRTVLNDPDPALLFGAVYGVFFLTENITEVFMMVHGHAIWVIFVYWTVVKLKRAQAPLIKQHAPQPKPYPLIRPLQMKDPAA